jgi:hypothetical protein
MDEQPPDWLVIMREDVETFRSDLRFVLDDMHQALDAADGAPWTKPGDLTVPIETAVTAIHRRLTQLTERIGRVTCASCGTALGWDDLGHERARCAVCTGSYEI